MRPISRYNKLFQGVFICVRSIMTLYLISSISLLNLNLTNKINLCKLWILGHKWYIWNNMASFCVLWKSTIPLQGICRHGTSLDFGDRKISRNIRNELQESMLQLPQPGSVCSLCHWWHRVNGWGNTGGNSLQHWHR